MRRNVFAATAAGAAVLLASCTTTPEASVPSPRPEGAPDGFSEYYSQTLELDECAADQVTMPRMREPKDLSQYRCGSVEAPLNWDDPESEPIELAVATYTAPGKGGLDPLFYNLGGPGGDAVQSLSAFATLIAPEAVVENFMLVAVDPRGVGESTPVTCWDDAGRDEFFSNPDDIDGMPIDEIVSTANVEMEELYEQCRDRSGEIVDFVDTDSAARDYDMLRALFGQEKLNYLGYSYGTALGATFAELFPTKVGRFVLDGALDPALSVNELAALQAGGMEEALYHWIDICQEEDGCPLPGDREAAIVRLQEFLASVREEPLPTDEADRPLTESLARTGIVGSLYSTESYPLLNTGLQMAFAGDGTLLLTLADFYNGREEDGTFNNSQDSFMVINALDYDPVGTPEEWEENAQKVAEDNPVLGEGFGYPSAGLDAWPGQSRAKRGKVTAEGANPIVIVGTTHDPATPYTMAESLAEALSNSVLVTYDGWGHGAYQRDGSTCLLDTVNSYLVGGDVPPKNTVCE